MLPQNREFPFDDYLYSRISAFLLVTDARMLFIYGQFDPWSAVMPSDPHKDNIKFFIQPGGQPQGTHSHIRRGYPERDKVHPEPVAV